MRPGPLPKPVTRHALRRLEARPANGARRRRLQSNPPTPPMGMGTPWAQVSGLQPGIRWVGDEPRGQHQGGPVSSLTGNPLRGAWTIKEAACPPKVTS